MFAYKTAFSLTITAGLMAIVICGCGQSGAPGDAAPPEVSGKRLATEVQSTGKPTAPVDISYSFEGRPAVGTALDIDVVVTPRVAAEALRVQSNTSGRHGLASSDSAKTFGEQRAGQANTYRVTIVPRSEGVFYLNVLASLDAGGHTQARAYAIPVMIGDAARQKSLAPNNHMRSTPSGEAIISLPAQEEHGK